MRQQSMTFRQQETQYVIDRWMASESCSLVGVGSVGKSNLLRHLADPHVHAHFGDASRKLKTIILDPYLLGPLPEQPDAQFRMWSAYELMMHRLYLAFYPFTDFGKDASIFYDAYQALQDGTNPLFAYMGIRYFELGLQYLLNSGYQVVFMFDEFDAWLKLMPVAYFQSLRGLRDNYKSQLMYLTFTRKPLLTVMQEESDSLRDLEPFYELLVDNTLYVGPYSVDDARSMLQRLAKRHQIRLTEHVEQFLLAASGHHAGLMRAAFKASDILDNLPLNYDHWKAVAALSSLPNVRTEVNVILESLAPNEVQALTAIVNGQPIDTAPQLISVLVEKGLVATDPSTRQLRILPEVLVPILRQRN
ncbi:MAG: hypothetical protein H6670_09275 [Anaerolineaceae bacterium]|nr:hypothetical protein [Anaerolineaceae bacterium]